MRLAEKQLQLAASDLSDHLSCRHLTALSHARARGEIRKPEWVDPVRDALADRGRDHEAAYVAHLREKHDHEVAELRDFEGEDAFERTMAAMHSGVGLIVQGVLREGRWQGRVDILRRVDDRASSLGDYSYEVIDTKLAQQTRGGTILQLCSYTDLLRQVVAPADPDALEECIYVVKPGEPFTEEEYRFAEFKAYYDVVRARLENAVDGDTAQETYPLPVEHCQICDWWQECRARRREDDHPCQVAGMSSLHLKELERQGVKTLAGFAERAKPLDERPDRGSPEVYQRLHAQAQIQLKGRKTESPQYELLPVEVDRGLAELPEPSPGDVFFDIESDRFAPDGGLEYLLGWAVVGEQGTLEYHKRWSLDHGSEKRAFEEFIDFVLAQWKQHEGMHVYHFTPYEPAALKRLMGRHASRAKQLDELLRGERFVDLHAVVRHGVRASVEEYSLKELEPFFEFERETDMRQAASARRFVAAKLQLGDKQLTEIERELIEGYNKDDCLATAGLHYWLESRRAELIEQGTPVPRPELKPGEAAEWITEREQRVQQAFDALVADLPEDRDAWSNEHAARWLLAHQLDYFHREKNCAWWEFFRMHELDHEELLREREAATGLQFVETLPRGGRTPTYRYRYPDQELAVSVGDDLHEVGRLHGRIGTVAGIDLAGRTLDIKTAGDYAHLRPTSVFAHNDIRPGALEQSLLAIGQSVVEHGIDGSGPFRAARDLLLRNPPRMKWDVPMKAEGVTTLDLAQSAAQSLKNSVLPIQGPPGTGKTYSGAQMIAEILRRGKRVGVTAVSHKVIRNLLDAVVKADPHALAAHKPKSNKSESEELPDRLIETKTTDDALSALNAGRVVGGTAWLWASEKAVETLDYLFVDEAGQMSLAHVLAASRAAKNLVLLGDPRQLEQPQRGAHPEGAEIAALDHVLGGAQTMPLDMGLFLEHTYRLHPKIRAFTSEQYYDGRLESIPGLENQALAGVSKRFCGSGLRYVPVAHEGNQSRSNEEVDAVAAIFNELVREGATWTDHDKKVHELTVDDVLIVAPYNAQIGALKARLPQARIGTVDKFQGQQAPVVIYSMTSSSAEDAPRGMSFLYSPNRTNVATSRAQAMCILVASPRLFEPECKTPEQMRWANGLCRYRELADEV